MLQIFHSIEAVFFSRTQAQRFFPHTFGAVISREFQSPIAEYEVRMIMRILLIAIKLVGNLTNERVFDDEFRCFLIHS